MGRLIPAGTGLGAYKRLSIHTDVIEGAEPLPPIVQAAVPLDEEIALESEAGE